MYIENFVSKLGLFWLLRCSSSDLVPPFLAAQKPEKSRPARKWHLTFIFFACFGNEDRIESGTTDADNRFLIGRNCRGWAPAMLQIFSAVVPNRKKGIFVVGIFVMICLSLMKSPSLHDIYNLTAYGVGQYMLQVTRFWSFCDWLFAIQPPTYHLGRSRSQNCRQHNCSYQALSLIKVTFDMGVSYTIVHLLAGT